MAFKASRDQLVRRDSLATDLCKKAIELNAAIEEFNRQLEPLIRAVAEAQSRYNDVMESARTLASEISTPAQDAFDAKSQRWQDSDVGIQVRLWIEQWELCLDDVELDLPEPLEKIDPEKHAGTLQSCPGRATVLQPVD